MIGRFSQLEWYFRLFKKKKTYEDYKKVTALTSLFIENKTLPVINNLLTEFISLKGAHKCQVERN